MGERFDVCGQQIDLCASIGVAFYPQHGETLHALLRSADMAMYQAKENGRNRVEFFSDELAKEMAGRAELERELDRKSVVSGKSVSVRVDLGGRRIIKKKTDKARQ